MCRYAFKKYKIHFVCFDCRKTFKKPPNEDLAKRNGDWDVYQKAYWNLNIGQKNKFRKENIELVKSLDEKYHNRKEKCPDCGGVMRDMGLDFKAPKKDKIKEWKIIEGLVRIGRVFHSCGCNGIGYIPKKKKDYINYLVCQRNYYQDRLTNRDAKLHKENTKDYINRFSQMISLIDLELIKISKDGG